MTRWVCIVAGAVLVVAALLLSWLAAVAAGVGVGLVLVGLFLDDGDG